jgi:histidyl-tRNA synthetase
MPGTAPDAYAIVPPGTALAPVMTTLEALRARGLRVVQHAGGVDGPGSMKSQFKKADASGAAWALVFGEEELAAGEVTLKALREGMQGNGGTGTQSRQALAQVDAWAALLESQA